MRKHEPQSTRYSNLFLALYLYKSTTIRSSLSSNGAATPIGKPMPTFEQGDVIRVPFPYTDRPTRQRRPALVVSAGRIGEGGSLLWVAMITSAENRPGPGDVPFGDEYAAAGLPAPSVVRPCKLATIEAVDADRLGRVPAPMRLALMDAIASNLGIP